MNLSISAPFLVGNQPEVYNISVGQLLFERDIFYPVVLYYHKPPNLSIFLTLSLTLSLEERTLNYSPHSGKGLGERVQKYSPSLIREGRGG